MTLLPMVGSEPMNTTEKISITLGRDELQKAKTLASRLGLSLSTVITDAVREHVEAQARKAAGLAVIASFTAADRPSEKKMQQLLQLWNQPQQPQQASSRVMPTAKRRTQSAKRRVR